MLTTIVDQRHLCPVDLEHAMVAWPYDYTMRLFPQPAVLAVCDSAPPWYEKYADCCAFNPGQFGNGGTYVQYLPAERRAEIHSVP
jgi:DNA polymerase epsilon subunit 2